MNINTFHFYLTKTIIITYNIEKINIFNKNKIDNNTASC